MRQLLRRSRHRPSAGNVLIVVCVRVSTGVISESYVCVGLAFDEFGELDSPRCVPLPGGDGEGIDHCVVGARKERC